MLQLGIMNVDTKLCDVCLTCSINPLPFTFLPFHHLIIYPGLRLDLSSPPPIPFSQVLSFSVLSTSWKYNTTTLLCRVFLGWLQKQAFLFVYNKSHLTKIFISRVAVPYKPISTQGKALSIIPFSIQIGNSKMGLCQRYQPPAGRGLSL